MENTGCFNANFTSIFILDTNILNFNFEVYQRYFQSHLHSISDQIINFEPELLDLKKTLPKLDLEPFTGFNQHYWLHPYVNKLRLEMEQFAQILKQSLYRRQMVKELKIEQDPWENFLAYDS